jgi:pyruvate dehydrogenase E2 component (dihydrolipoamide acetyltransferase)
MAEIVHMPKLSDTMTEGVVAAWHKKVGDKVSSGDLLADIETDKATMEFESFYDGVLLHIGVETGKSAPVNSILAIIGEAGTDVKALLAQEANGSAPAETQNTPVAPTVVEEKAPAAAPQAAVDLSKFKAQVVEMPKLSDTMTDGVVAAWHKKVGDTVASGDILAEIETDKATMEFESFYDGILLHIGVEKGQSAPVNSILAIIGEKGTDVQALLAAYGSKAAAPVAEAAPSVAPSPTPVSAPSPAPAAAHQKQAAPAPVMENTGRINVSPLARKMAEERGIHLGMIKGSGDNGRIIKRDIDAFVPGTMSGMSTVESFHDEPVSQMRKTIARRLAESKFTAPHFYLNLEINMDNAIAARTAINNQGGGKISFNDMVIKAVAKALKKHPNVNSSWYGDFIRRNEHVHIGVAVAVEDGLLVPVVRFADTKSFQQIGAEVKEYAQKAKDKKLQPADWEGNTFTISNLGMFGIESFTAIINPPDSCILAVGGIKEVPVVKNGQLAVGNIMKVTLSCDHRVVDGATGAAFLQTLKAYLEDPILMFA